MTFSVQSREQLKLLEDFQLYEQLITRYAGCDSGVTCVSGNMFLVITEAAVLCRFGPGGTMSA